MFIVLTKKYSFTRLPVLDSFTQCSEATTDVFGCDGEKKHSQCYWLCKAKVKQKYSSSPRFEALNWGSVRRDMRKFQITEQASGYLTHEWTRWYVYFLGGCVLPLISKFCVMIYYYSYRYKYRMDVTPCEGRRTVARTPYSAAPPGAEQKLTRYYS
jgi:hypothetical protein